MWKIWKSVLHSTFCSVHSHKLDIPVGKWTDIPYYWNWFSNGDLLVFKDTNGTIEYHFPSGGSARRKQYQLKKGVTNINISVKNLVPTTVNKHLSFLTTGGTSSIQKYHIDNSDTSPDHHVWLRFEHDSCHDDNKLIEDILNRTATASSDGSYYEEFEVGAAAWTITNSSQQPYSTGTSIVPSTGDTLCAY